MKIDSKYSSAFNLYLSLYLFAIFLIYFKTAYNGYHIDLFNFLYNYKEKFSDMVEVFAMVKNNDPYFRSEGWHPTFYPPGAYFFVVSLRDIGIDSMEKWSWLHLLLSAFFVYLYNKFVNKLTFSQLIFFTLLFLMSYPVLFGMDRGNLEIICVLLVAYALVIPQPYIKAILIGLSASMKLIPIVYILIFLRNKQYKEIIITFTTIAFVTLFALAYFDAPILDQFKQFLINVSGHGRATLTDPLLYHSYNGPKEYIMQGGTTSLFDSIRLILLLSNIYYPGDAPYLVYKIFFVSLGLYTLTRLKYLSVNDVMVLAAILSIVVVPLSYIPRLSIVIPVLLILINTGSNKFFVYLSLFLLIPKSFYPLLTKVDINQILIPLSFMGYYFYLLYNTYIKKS